MSNKSVFLEADIKLLEETAARREKAETIIDLPKGRDKQPDLLYFSAIFVSSGENLNHAFFLPSELVKAEGTIINKALDIEHKEEEIIGHIYERAFITEDGKKLDLKELANMEIASLDQKDIHVVIAGIIYKNRFPNIADEVASGKWKVSMEAYYQDYDVKIGSMTVTRKEAELLGLASLDEDILGKLAKVIRKGKEVANGTIARVLKNITFSGCGVVKTPANPPSVVLETANNKEIIILSYNDSTEDTEELQDNKLTTTKLESTSLDEKSSSQYNDSVGICVSFKKRLLDSSYEAPDTKVLKENWCQLYEKSCTSFSRDTTDPECLRVKAAMAYAKAAIEVKLEQMEKMDNRQALLLDLDKAVTAAETLLKV